MTRLEPSCAGRIASRVFGVFFLLFNPITDGEMRVCLLFCFPFFFLSHAVLLNTHTHTCVGVCVCIADELSVS